MIPISPDRDRHIRAVIRQCGLQAEQMAAKGFEVFEKGPEDYVTNIDATLDAKLSATFADLFPDDGLITEENPQSSLRFQAACPRFWCIDPLDGTEDFIYGKRNYSVMVGLLEHYQPLAGWIYAPTQDRMVFGGVGWGLFEAEGDNPPTPLAIAPTAPNPQRLRVLIGHRDQKQYGDAIVAQLPNVEFYSIGSFGLKVLEVITGQAELYVYFNRRVKLWDTTGPLALAHAAGLTCCSLEGEPIRFVPDAVDTTTLAHKQAILVGRPHYIEQLRPQLLAAVHTTSQK